MGEAECGVTAAIVQRIAKEPDDFRRMKRIVAGGNDQREQVGDFIDGGQNARTERRLRTDHGDMAIQGSEQRLGLASRFLVDRNHDMADPAGLKQRPYHDPQHRFAGDIDKAFVRDTAAPGQLVLYAAAAGGDDKRRIDLGRAGGD